MKFTLSWLKDHLETEASLEAITDKLTMLGLEVEGVEDPAAKLGAFSVARIVEAGPHPNADKLKLCSVEAMVDGKLERLQVVCGAPNARAGLVGVFAPSGATIPVNGMVLKPTKIRGVESNGMMCSERELELSDEHDGIIDLEGDFPVGMPAAEALGQTDPVIEIAITPNRPDCLGVRGVARDLAAAGLGTLKPLDISAVPGGFDSPVGIQLDFPAEATDACPLFAGRLIRGVTNGESPAWMQARLRAIGLRPINALVDITNYLSYDLNRPLHVYDAAKLNGDIGARLGRGDTFLALDGKEYTADETMCVIADNKKALGFGGIMGGEASGSTEATTEVFVESAYFDPRRTAATGRKTGINSDARYRFERGVDPAFVVDGLERATALILELCGGEPSTVTVAGAVPAGAEAISFDPALVKRLTGVGMSPTHCHRHLEALGFEVRPEREDRFSVTAPSWRPDIMGAADLVEEVVRVHGLSEVASTPLARAHGVADPVMSLSHRRMRTARRGLAARGFVEAVTWSFVDEAQAALFGADPADGRLTLANPISSELSRMRPSLVPGLMAAAGRNVARGFGDLALFEAGRIFEDDTPEGETHAVAGLRQGTARPYARGRHWQGAAGPVEAMDAKADALALLSVLGAPIDNLQFAAEAPSWLHPGRSGVLRLGPKQVLGVFGELHPSVLDAMDVKGPMVVFEIYPDVIPAPKRRATRAKPPLDLSDLQPVRRDFAFIVARDTKAGDLLKAVKGAEKTLIQAVDLFDVFEGGAMAADEKSLAVEVTLQPKDRTLTEEDLEAVSAKIVAAAEKAVGAKLRG